MVGIAKVIKEGYPDFTAWDPKEKYYDPKTDKENPRWYMVDIQFVERFNEVIALSQMKTYAELEGMMVLQKGSRLSIQPVQKEHFDFIKKVGQAQR